MVIDALGDSLTHNITLGVRPTRLWPAVLMSNLTREGKEVTVRNFGRSGRTTANTATNLLDRFKELLTWETPEIALVWGGANDPGGGISTADTTINLRGIVMGLQFGAKLGAVAAQTDLPAGCLPGDRYVVLADGSTTGGAALVGFGSATITGSIAAGAPTVWECRNGAAGVAGWGRVATAGMTPTHVAKVALIGMHYLNFASGSGDDILADPVVVYAAYDDATGVRKAQKDAAAATGAVYVDLYKYMADTVVAAPTLRKTDCWGVAAGNQHLNARGMTLVADCVRAALAAQGWV